MKYKKVMYFKNKINFLMTVIASFMLMACNVYIAILLMELIDTASDEGVEGLKIIIVKSLIFVVINASAGFIHNFFKNKFSYNAITNLKDLVFERMLNKNVNTFNVSTTSKYISIFTNDIKEIEIDFVESCPNFIQQVVLLLGGLGVMIYLNPILSICVIVSLSIPIFVTFLFGNKIVENEKKVSNQNGKFTECLKDMITGFSVIKNFKAEREIQTIFCESNSELEIIKKQKKSVEYVIGILTGLSGTLVLIIVFAIGAYMSIKNIINISMVIAFIQLLNYVVGPIQDIPVLYSKMKAADNLLLKIEDEIENQEEIVGSVEHTSFESVIEMKGISFSYPNNKVLDDITLNFERGKSYAIVGGSGSGKSTILKLLLGYLTGYDGELLLDGIPINSLMTESLYDLMTIMQQNVIIFNETIKTNISMYKPYDEDKMDYAIKVSGLESVLKEKGEQYKCGENGNNLSGGEKQRVAIARALLRETPILIMDEATAALDNSTAHVVENAILDLQDVTKIIVTHKLNRDILIKYDQIIVISNGKIEESGSFEELWKRKKTFYSLYNMSVNVK